MELAATYARQQVCMAILLEIMLPMRVSGSGHAAASSNTATLAAAHIDLQLQI